MKVLLTGASGLVGSHVLDRLVREQVPVRLLLRASSPRQWIASHLSKVEIHEGALDAPQTLESALEGITHVIHCAGATKALDREGYFRVNHAGTLNLVAAINRQASQVQRLVHVSSLAVTGPATAARPARETDPPRPLTDYGQSKLAAEQVVREQCRVPSVILRPPGVYGPRDGEFFKLFKAVQRGLLPCFGGGRQQLSLVYAPDLAAAIVHCLTQEGAVGQVLHVAHPEVVSARQLGEMAARFLQVKPVPLVLPTAALWPVCVVQEIISQVTRRPHVVNLQKYRELAAPGWVCDVSRLRELTGFSATTSVQEGVPATLEWYRQAGWLK
ncbi:NAD(P)-dependent oxidoreductase [Fontisphaera persica]|uniref:NAD-dependent epimerase/dehydratase family protein n=1 Tax=Fontisphaera persica TaxID=2974023 RepID=UPI0024BFA254|nr:NAD(P)-dependent oxidoreductase [Fontisphaera persica]WCJ59547.1 NAD(P)-dependent oxidoreductase [Fontisphaera persica]